MTDDFAEIRDAVARLCADFPGPYWRDKDRARAYPTEFVEALSAAGLSDRPNPIRSGTTTRPARASVGIMCR